MSDEERFEELFRAIMDYEKETHMKNKKRIKIGIHCLIWIPLFFMVLLFLTESSKAIFLILWIASLFIIATYLIYVEYSDFKMQEKITTISNREIEGLNVLIGQDLDEIERAIIASVKHLEVKKDEKIDEVIEEVNETLQQKAAAKLEKQEKKAQKKLAKQEKKAQKKLAKQEKKAQKKLEKQEKKAQKKIAKQEKAALKNASKIKDVESQEIERGDSDEDNI